MKVRALREGYYKHQRRKPGQVFEVGEEFFNHPADPETGKRDKKKDKVLPDWVEDASKPEKKEAKKLPFPGARVTKPRPDSRKKGKEESSESGEQSQGEGEGSQE